MKKFYLHFFRFFKILFIIIYYESLRFLNLIGVNLFHKPLVNFVMAGVQRGGTSALYGYLLLHPSISLGKSLLSSRGEPFEDETKFFDQEENFSISYTTSFATLYGSYHKNFFEEHIKKNTLVGSNAPIYTYWENALKRLWFYNKDIKIIVCLRNPISRAYSHWNKEVVYGRENKDFLTCLKKESEITKTALPYQHRIYSYADRGFYSEQIRRIWRFFEKKNTLFIKSEELLENPQKIIDQVCDFLAIHKIELKNKINDGAVKYKSKIKEEEKKYLLNLYEFEIKQIERMLQWDCSDWLKL